MRPFFFPLFRVPARACVCVFVGLFVGYFYFVRVTRAPVGGTGMVCSSLVARFGGFVGGFESVGARPGRWRREAEWGWCEKGLGAAGLACVARNGAAIKSVWGGGGGGG